MELSLIIKNSSYVTLCLFAVYSYYNNIISEKLFYTLSIYTFLDTVLYKNKMDILIHHYLLLLLTYFHYNYGTKIDIEMYHKMKLICLSFEVSSIFLGLMPFMKKMNNNIQMINYLMFFSSFFYYRIYKFSEDFVYDFEKHMILNEFRKEEGNKPYIMFYIIFMGFYFLNMFWFIFICKKMVKKIMKIKDE